MFVHFMSNMKSHKLGLLPSAVFLYIDMDGTTIPTIKLEMTTRIISQMSSSQTGHWVKDLQIT